MTLLVEQPALVTTVQDLGRTGYQLFGMPESGPMDWWAHRAANKLVGNDPGEACLELGFSSAVFQLEANSLLAVTGAGYELRLNDRQIPLWMSFIGHPGDRITLEKVAGGNWAYLSVSGGVRTPVWMGSRSFYPRAGLGQPLSAGDRVPLGLVDDVLPGFAGRSLPKMFRPYDASSTETVLRTVPGPHQNRFAPDSLIEFTEVVYQLSPRSDRMGYRLTGPTLAHRYGADLISQGMVLGEIQVPGEGQPVVMMPDHPTTGGYTCIGTVIRYDLPRLVQAEPKKTQLRFLWVDVSAAQKLYCEAIEKINHGISSEEDLWLQL